MELQDLFSALWKRRFLVVFVVAATTLLSGAFALTRADRYESTATIALTPSKQAGFVTPDSLEALVNTYAQTAKSNLVLGKAEEELGESIPGTVDTSTQPGTGILQIIGKAETAAGAAVTAEAVSKAFVADLEDSDLFEPQIVDPATEVAEPVEPRPPLIIGIGLVLGILAGVMLAYLLEQVRKRVDTTADVSEVTPLPIVGALPYERRLARASTRLIWDDPNLTLMQESVRSLRTNLELLVDSESDVVLVTSPLSGEGKSTIVANLGVSLAQIGIETMIVDADLRRPVQHSVFGVRNDVGLSTFLAGRDELEPVPTEQPRLSLLPSGPLLGSSTETIAVHSSAMVKALRASQKLVLVDAPPVLAVSDTRILAPSVDGVLLAVAAGKEKPATLRSALDSLQFSGSSLLGIALNRAADEFARPRYEYTRTRQRGRRPHRAGNPTPR